MLVNGDRMMLKFSADMNNNNNENEPAHKPASQPATPNFINKFTYLM